MKNFQTFEEFLNESSVIGLDSNIPFIINTSSKEQAQQSQMESLIKMKLRPVYKSSDDGIQDDENGTFIGYNIIKFQKPALTLNIYESDMVSFSFDGDFITILNIERSPKIILGDDESFHSMNDIQPNVLNKLKSIK